MSTSGKLILLQAQTRPRPKKNLEKGKQCPVHDKHAEMERLQLAKTLVSRHPHEEVPTPAPTTKLRLRPLLLSLTPEFVQGATITTGMRHKAGMGMRKPEGSKLNPASPDVESSVSLALGFSPIPAPSKSDSGFLHKQHAARELDSGQLPCDRIRNPNRYR
ncbi:hypothetical protein F2Q70_00029564 [Brassica cretica]|uniref:Uncharacterized protein n=1 Tax=Brassica cretica TaxID=69181 RepID=A0A8S9FLU8_BRACR|nr:hypothetical protein F2Q70_00029564 [Brassica cretica]